MSENVKMVEVTSSNIERVGYDDEKGKLIVEFVVGFVYEYEGVEKNVFKRMLEAESIGRFFHKNIKQGGYNYKRIK